MLDCERVARAGQLHPVRHLNAALGIACSAPIGEETTLERDTVVRRHDHHHVLGARVQRLANHHAGLGPLVRVPDAVYSRDEAAVAVELFVGKAEFIRLAFDVHATGAHRDAVGPGLLEAHRVAPEPQAQVRHAVGAPVLRHRPGPLGLRIERRRRIVVVQRHRLAAIVSVACLDDVAAEVGTGIAPDVMAHDGAGVVARNLLRLGIAQAVHPRLEDAIRRIVRVALEIIHREERRGREDPNVAFGNQRTALVQFIDLPVDHLTVCQVRTAQVVAVGLDCTRESRTVFHGRPVGADVYLVRGGPAARTPVQHGIQSHV